MELRLQPEVSRLAMVLHGVLHGAAACAALCIMILPWAIRIALALLVWGFWAMGAGRLRETATIRLRFDRGNHCRWWTADGTEGEGRVAGSTVVTPWVVFLHLRGNPGRALALWRDALAPEDFRRLRVLLRTQAAGTHD